jgi:hypothetical protein
VKTVFVDSSFWIAITRPADPLREAALQALDELVLDTGGPLALRKLGIPPEVTRDFIAELM